MLTGAPCSVASRDYRMTAGSTSVPKRTHQAGRTLRRPCQTALGSRVVTSWTIHALPSGSSKEKNDP